MPTGDHDALTQTTGAIHPAAWVSATDPGAIGAHKLWIDTSTVVPFQLNKRNAGNTAWEEVGPSAITDPTTTRGDFITRDITSLVRLAVGANQTMLTSNGTDPSWSATPVLSGLLTAVGIKTSGITGATGTVRVMGGTASGAPASGTFEQRDMVVDNAGSIYVCTVAGTPGTWVRVPSDVTTTRGDLVVRGASAIGRLAIGTSGSVLVSDGTDPSWDDTPTLSGLLTATALKASGLTGAANAARLVGRTASGAPLSGTFELGDMVPDNAGSLWLCTSAGTPGTWAEVSGSGGAGGGGAATLDVAGVFQQTKIEGTTSITTTSTSFVVIDNTDLPAKSLTLTTGDIVKLTIMGQAYSSSTNLTCFDFQVVQPTSGTVRVNANAENGAGLMQGTTRSPVNVVSTFTATDTGVHTFQAMWRASAGTSTLSNATSGNDDTAILFTAEKVGVLQIPYLRYEDQKSNGTAGGTFTSGAWRTRDMNTEVEDTHARGSVTANQITLPAGTYRTSSKAIANIAVVTHQARIQDITNAATLALGLTTGGGTAHVQGRFTLSASAAIELQHRCATSKSTDGFGVAGSFGNTEVYAVVELWKDS